jgi:hypothetical protein
MGLIASQSSFLARLRTTILRMSVISSRSVYRSLHLVFSVAAQRSSSEGVSKIARGARA